MHILITGISSYVARRILPMLLMEGIKVTGLSRSNPEIHHSGFKWIACDLFNLSEAAEDQIINGIEGESMGAVIHMAAQAWAGKPASDYISSNVYVTMNVARLARKIKPRFIFYTSSIDTYGTVQSSELKEDTPSINPGIYGMCKKLGEYLCHETAPTISLRLPAILAKGSHGWLAGLYQKLKSNDPIEFKNSLFNNVVHADDIGKVILAALMENKVPAGVYNIACRDFVSSIDVIQHMKQKLGSTSELSWEEAKNSYTISYGPLADIIQTKSVIEAIDLYIDEMHCGPLLSS